MQSLRRGLALRLPKHDIFSSSLKQQTAAMSKVEKGEGSSDGRLQMMLKALEPQALEDIAMTPEEFAEAEKRAKEYSKLKMQQHRQWQADLTTKLKLKQAAIAALPPELQAAAMVPDDAPFPSNRHIWTVTAPVEEAAAGPIEKQRTGKRTLGTKRR